MVDLGAFSKKVTFIMDDDFYKITEELSNKNIIKILAQPINSKDKDKNKMVLMFKKLIEEINFDLLEKSDGPKNINDDLNKLENAAYLMAQCNCKELTTLFLDICFPHIVLECIKPEYESIDPHAPIKFISNSLSLPGDEIGDKYLEIGLFDYIMGKAAEDIPMRESITALINIIPSITDEDKIQSICDCFPMHKILSVNYVEHQELVYPLLFLGKTLYKTLKVEFDDEDVHNFVSLIDKIFSSPESYVSYFDQENGFYPLLNTFIDDIIPLSFSLPDSFFRHIIHNILDFSNIILNFQCLSISKTIVRILRKYTPSMEPIRTTLFNHFMELYNSGNKYHFFTKIIESIQTLHPFCRSSFYDFIIGVGYIFPIIYTEEAFLPLIEYIQHDFQDSLFCVKEPILKILRKFIQISGGSSFNHITPDFIENLVTTIQTQGPVSFKSIKLLIDLYNALIGYEFWETVREHLQCSGIVEVLQDLIEDEDDERIAYSEKLLLQLITQDEEE